jgi:HEPN domain-containing protein
MKQTTAEWVKKAESDFATMEREAAVAADPNYDIICFLAQQCAEKYLKARLCEATIEFSKIHNLSVLLDQVINIEPQWESYREKLLFLNQFAVKVRYPGAGAEPEDVHDALEFCRDFRRVARKALQLDPGKDKLG